MKKLTLSVALVAMMTVSASAGTTIHQIVGDLMQLDDASTDGSDYVAMFSVGDIGTVLDVDVCINWFTDYIGDNLFQLGFNGGVASMLDNDESTYAELTGDFIWDDEAPLSFYDGITIPGDTLGPKAEFVPEGAYHSSDTKDNLLSVFDGMNAEGMWVMTMSNTFGTTTEVYSISLKITVEEAVGEVIPLPAPILLGLTGLLGVAALRRRIRTF